MAQCRNPDCGCVVGDQAAFCGVCGTPIRAYCSKCGEPIPARWNIKACPHCGMMISDMPGAGEPVHVPPPVNPVRPVNTTPPIYRAPADGRTVAGSLNLNSEPAYVGPEPVSPEPGTITPVDQIKTNRSLGMYIILTLVTAGIYSIIFHTKVGTDLNKIASRYDGKKTMHFCLIFFVLTFLTFGIADLVWFHKMSDRVGQELRRRGYEKTVSSDTFWLWGVLGSLIVIGPFIYLYKLIGAMNTLAEDYNARG